MTRRKRLEADDNEADRKERLLELAHVSKRLSLCDESVRRLIRSGKLPGIKLDGGWRVQQGDLDTFIAARRFTGRNKTPHPPA